MREIKFRGKRKDNGEWVYGDLRQENSGRKVIMTNLNTWGDNPDDIEPYGEDVIVNPDTIGQYTGLKDKNGKEIYEGDIISIIYKYDNYTDNGVIPDQDCDCLGVVEYSEYTAAYELRIMKAEYPLDGISYKDECSFHLYSFDLEGSIDLCGNIHDTPELMED